MTRAEYRKQLYMTIAVILSLALALTASTFAWFNASASAAVMPIDLQVGSTAALEISIDESTGYSNRLNYSDIETFVNKLLATDGLVPVSSVDCSSFYAQNGYNAQKLVTAFRLVSSKDGYYFQMPVYLKCATDMDVYLSDDVTVTSPEGEYLDRAIRIGFVTDDSTVIYAPNPAEDTPGRSSTAVGQTGENDAVTSENGDFETQNTLTLSQLAVGFDPSNPSASDPSGKTSVAHLTAGAPEMLTIYLWIEGMDYDSVVAVASNMLTVNLYFTGIGE